MLFECEQPFVGMIVASAATETTNKLNVVYIRTTAIHQSHILSHGNLLTGN